MSLRGVNPLSRYWTELSHRHHGERMLCNLFHACFDITGSKEKSTDNIQHKHTSIHITQAEIKVSPYVQSAHHYHPSTKDNSFKVGRPFRLEALAHAHNTRVKLWKIRRNVRVTL